MDRERFAKQLEFCLELDKEKNIFRQTHLSGHGRRENDAEHAWHMATSSFLLFDPFNYSLKNLPTRFPTCTIYIPAARDCTGNVVIAPSTI